jgi:hypothetical protein
LSWIRFAASASLVAGAALVPLAGCGTANDLVGGSCASGYAPCGAACCPVYADASVDGLADSSYADSPTGDVVYPDQSTQDQSAEDSGEGGQEDAENDGSGGEGGTTCTPPLVDCDGVCVDLTSNPYDCGACNKFCPSLICVNSQCVGATSGAVVFIGHDYDTSISPQSAQARVLSNAVFMPQVNPVAVLSYERYADSRSINDVSAILTAAATQLGRAVNITATNTDGDIPDGLTYASFQVLLVHDQPKAQSGALASLGANWASTLATFTQAGGVVIVLDGGKGVGEMPQFTTATGLLSVTAHQSLANSENIFDVAPGDAVGIGVVSPYGATQHSVSVTTEPNGGGVVYVVEEASTDAGPGAPVVVHKIM